MINISFFLLSILCLFYLFWLKACFLTIRLLIWWHLVFILSCDFLWRPSFIVIKLWTTRCSSRMRPRGLMRWSLRVLHLIRILTLLRAVVCICSFLFSSTACNCISFLLTLLSLLLNRFRRLKEITIASVLCFQGILLEMISEHLWFCKILIVICS